MRVLFSITAAGGERIEYGEVELREHGRWFVVQRDGIEIATHDRSNLISWTVCAPPAVAA